MIYTGVDLIEIARIARAAERYGDRFLARIFTASELERCAGRPESLAARWAAKEAAAKLLGVGLRGLGAGPQADAVAWTEIELLNDRNGRPVLTFHGAAADRARALGLTAVDVSLSHTRELAIASVVALATA